MNPVCAARARGSFIAAGGGRPLVHPRGFAPVCGPESEELLQRTTASWSMPGATDMPDALVQTCRAGLGTVVTPLPAGPVHVPRGPTRPPSLPDAAARADRLPAWRRRGPLRPRDGAGR